mmetsp:Transcript_23669/g.51929  ORF Transcript_23669/g.51929 Transcript_23669/m.51929 type:complete len:224 (+) Transcript_23669:527-1198(+)
MTFSTTAAPPSPPHQSMNTTLAHQHTPPQHLLHPRQRPPLPKPQADHSKSHRRQAASPSSSGSSTQVSLQLAGCLELAPRQLPRQQRSRISMLVLLLSSSTRKRRKRRMPSWGQHWMLSWVWTGKRQAPRHVSTKAVAAPALSWRCTRAVRNQMSSSIGGIGRSSRLQRQQGRHRRPQQGLHLLLLLLLWWTHRSLHLLQHASPARISRRLQDRQLRHLRLTP